MNVKNVIILLQIHLQVNLIIEFTFYNKLINRYKLLIFFKIDNFDGKWVSKENGDFFYYNEVTNN